MTRFPIYVLFCLLAFYAGGFSYWLLESAMPSLFTASVIGWFITDPLLPASLTGTNDITLFSREGFEILRGPVFVMMQGLIILAMAMGARRIAMGLVLWNAGYVAYAYGLVLPDWKYDGFYQFMGPFAFYGMHIMIALFGAAAMVRIVAPSGRTIHWGKRLRRKRPAPARYLSASTSVSVN